MYFKVPWTDEKTKRGKEQFTPPWFFAPEKGIVAKIVGKRVRRVYLELANA